jgi:hypothetical protein
MAPRILESSVTVKSSSRGTLKSTRINAFFPEKLKEEKSAILLYLGELEVKEN